MEYFLNEKVKTELLEITVETLEIIKDPHAKLFLENFYSRLKVVVSEEQWVEIFMELSTIMYFDFSFSPSELKNIDRLLLACEKIARTQEADMSQVN